jgi:hypothetical protein
MLLASVIKPDNKSWNHNQIINYCWSGDINDGPDNLGFSLDNNPYLPLSVTFGGRFDHNYQAPAQLQEQDQPSDHIEINEDLFEDLMISSHCQIAQAQGVPTRGRPTDQSKSGRDRGYPYLSHKEQKLRS